MRILTAIALVLLIFLSACAQRATPIQDPGIGGGQRNPDCVCIALYAPVCGNNGRTYSNSCEASCWGISEFTEGEC